MEKRTNLKAILVMAVFLAGLAPAVAAGKTIYVDANTPDNNDGTNWARAFDSLSKHQPSPPTNDRYLPISSGTQNKHR